MSGPVPLLPSDRHGRPRVVIVGAGFGGLAAARELKDAAADVTVVDRRNHHLFQPLLYQVATATLSPADVGIAIRGVLRHHKNTEVLMEEVTGIDPARRAVATRRLTLFYDHLVIATGSADKFGHADWASHVLSLKSIEDALEIRRRVLTAVERAEACADETERRRLMTVVLVGGGPTGVEMAGSLAELTKLVLPPDFRNVDPRAARIILAEAGDRLLASFPDRLQCYAKRSLERKGVEVCLSCPAGNIDGSGITLRRERVETQIIIWAAGQRAAAPVARWLGLDQAKDGRVAVGPNLTVPGHPEIHVIGDTAAARGEDGEPLPGLAAVAAQQGRYVGRALARSLAGGEDPGPFRYRNRGTMATIGRGAAVADFGRVEFGGWFAWALWGAVHVYELIGFRNRLSVLLNWLWAYVTVRRGARIILDYRCTERGESRPAVQLRDRTRRTVPAPSAAPGRE